MRECIRTGVLVRSFFLVILFSTIFGLACCGSYSGAKNPPPPTSVTVSPASPDVTVGTGTEDFTATVGNDYLNRGVNWSLSGAGCSGATCGTLTDATTSTVTYHAPAAVPNPATVTLTATSINSAAKFGTATITIEAAAAARAAVSLTMTDTPSAANQVTHVQLESRGTTQIGGLAPRGSMPSVLTLRMRNHPDPDAGVQAGSGPKLAIPGPNPRPVSTAGRNAFGFNALNSIDSALVNEGFVSEPPDQGLCVGNGFVMEAINSAVAVYNPSSGALLAGPLQLNAFFKLDFAQFTSDPRCFFDKPTRRWYVTLLQIDIDPSTGNVTNHSHGLIAVSTSADPTSTFSVFAFDTTDDGTNGTQNHAGCPCFGDQPLLGADANGFFYSTNEFSITALTGAGQVFSNGAQVYAMSKKLLGAGLSPTVVHFGDIPLTTGHFARSIQPAQSSFTGNGDNEQNDRGVEFFVSHLNFTHTLDNRIAVWAISDTRTLNNANPHVGLSNVIITSEVYGDPPSATQKAGANPFGASQVPPQPEGELDTGDTRMQQVYFADGLLWTSLTTIVQQGNNQLAGGAYFVIQPDFNNGHVRAQIQEQGYITVANNNVLYPAISANDNGQAVITFTVSGPDFFPSAAYARLNADNGTGNVRIIGLGAFPDDGFTVYPPFSNGVGRWGDYSAAAVDESGNLWFATEYIPPTLSGFPQGLGVNFGTFIGTLNVSGSQDDQ